MGWVGTVVEEGALECVKGGVAECCIELGVVVVGGGEYSSGEGGVGVGEEGGHGVAGARGRG